jgi:hypothetical protein
VYDPIAPNAPMINPVLIIMFPSLKWLALPERTVKTIDVVEVPSAVWIGILKTLINNANTNPEPPPPANPRINPKQSIVKKIVMFIVTFS